MLIRKAYKCRLKTNPEIEQKLFQQAGCVRWVWNQVWSMNQLRLENKQPLLWYNESAYWLQLWKSSDEYGFLKGVHSQPLQQVLIDLDRAYQDGFDKNQPLKRLPKRKKRNQHISFRYPQGIKVNNRQVYLPKIGWVGFHKSKEIDGVIKNATLSFTSGHWYISIQVEKERVEPVHQDTGSVGIDVGVAQFASLSNGITYPPLNAYRRHIEQLKKEQRKLSRMVKFSENWKRQKAKIQQIHHKIACCRSDYLHKTSTEISKSHAMIFVEDLKVGNMSRSAKGDLEQPGRNVSAKSGLNRSILDQGWSEFRRQLEYKSEWAGGMVVAVPPHHTSQRCSACGHTHASNRLSQSQFSCTACGHEENADTNAAKNIEAAGLAVLACGESGLPHSSKQEPVGAREGVPPHA